MLQCVCVCVCACVCVRVCVCVCHGRRTALNLTVKSWTSSSLRASGVAAELAPSAELGPRAVLPLPALGTCEWSNAAHPRGNALMARTARSAEICSTHTGKLRLPGDNTPSLHMSTALCLSTPRLNLTNLQLVLGGAMSKPSQICEARITLAAASGSGASALRSTLRAGVGCDASGSCMPVSNSAVSAARKRRGAAQT